jgi:hypothetical protein
MARRGLGSPRLVWFDGSMVGGGSHSNMCGVLYVVAGWRWRRGVARRARPCKLRRRHIADDRRPTRRPWMDGPLAWLSHPAPSHATPLSLRSDRTNPSEPGRWRTGILLISATARLTRRRPPHSPSPPDARPSFVPTDVSPRPSPWHPPSDCKYFAKWAGMLPMLP